MSDRVVIVKASGRARLKDGAATVDCPALTPDLNIFIFPQDAGITGPLQLGSRTDGDGFEIMSGNGGDNGVVAWEVHE